MVVIAIYVQRNVSQSVARLLKSISQKKAPVICCYGDDNPKTSIGYFQGESHLTHFVRWTIVYSSEPKKEQLNTPYSPLPHPQETSEIVL